LSNEGRDFLQTGKIIRIYLTDILDLNGNQHGHAVFGTKSAEAYLDWFFFISLQVTK
jgi:hypothetical protein